ncbi:AMP-binding protein [Kangiella sediminilitoris]|uniref:Acyl-CoA synthetase (AMP-forming)/AMP-acid ligase II n=1 Tax=Kangiella sediminilitoris TaxID=1144748 RepID=A0A1B3B915_9GAMM|nr:AMP-binding protein [Kangiella sediminilitoris]AOE49298.1 Acyl-CoA synthetase (AMP-forming)/AMP-acid ligase II [Kangiella sediminilitoris]
MSNQSIISIAFKHAKETDPLWRFPAESSQLRLSEILSDAEQYAAFLVSKGVTEQDRVGFVMGNSSTYIKLMLATWMLNAVAVPLRPQGGKYVKYEEYLTGIDEICDLQLLFHDPEIPAEVMAAWSEKSGKQVYSTCILEDSGQWGDVPTPVEPGKTDLAVLQFTSGSTGTPKGVMVTHKMVIEQLDQLHGNHYYSRQGRVVESAGSWLPLNHDMGLFIGFLLPIYDGCDNILSPTSFYMRNPGRWFRLMSEHGVDLNFTTNSVLFSSLKSIKRLVDKDVDLSKLHIYVAAEKVHPNILRKAQDLFGQLGMPAESFHIGYGMAENALGCTRTPHGTIKTLNVAITDDKVRLAKSSDKEVVELVSVGIPNVNHIITIRNDNDEILPDLTLGEINIVSDCVTPGYYNNPEATEQSVSGGRLRTGDLGFSHAGEFYFYSRKDDMLITNGRNIVPDDLEIAAEEIDGVGVGRTCLLGVENKETGVLELTLLVEEKQNISNEELGKKKLDIQSHLYQSCDVLITKVIFCERGTIEKTSSGKKRRKVIRQRYINNETNLVGTINECAA